MGNGRSKSQEVASKVDGDPLPRARVRHGIPPGRVDTGRERAAMEKRSRLLASESARRRIETENDGVAKQLRRNEAYRSVERRGQFGEQISHGRR